MKLKIDYIEKNGKHLNIYIKVPYFRRFVNYADYFKQFKDNDNFLDPHLECDGKHIKMTFILRNKEDILPYIKQDNKEIYERLNEIQYLLKFTYSKKKIRRKVKEIMDLIKKEVE